MRPARARLAGGGECAVDDEDDAADDAELQTRIARVRSLVTAPAEERYRALLAPHLEAFANDRISAAELERHKATARATAEAERTGKLADVVRRSARASTTHMNTKARAAAHE